MEAVAQEMLNAPTDESIERMEEIKERAFQTYMLRQEQEVATKREKDRAREYVKRGPSPGLMTAVAVALALVLFPLISEMLFPVRVSIADDGWKRTVIIWLNDTFHTKIQVPESVHDDGGISQLDVGEERVFHDIDEAARFVGGSLVAIGDDVWKSDLSSITVQAIDEDIYRVVERYRVDGIEVVISLKTVLDRQTDAPRVETYIINTRIGEMFLWSQEEARYGYMIAGEWVVMVSADCSIEEAQHIFSTIYMVN